MDSKSRVPVWVSFLAATAVAGLLVVAGCALDKNGSSARERVHPHRRSKWQLIEPKRCMLKVVILSRPFADPAINEVVWRVADEQVIRSGRAAGLGSQRPPRRPDHRRVSARARSDPQGYGSRKEDRSDQRSSPESGEQSLIRISDSVEQASLLLNRDNRAFGKDYNDASGYLPRDRRGTTAPTACRCGWSPRSTTAQSSATFRRCPTPLRSLRRS